MKYTVRYSTYPFRFIWINNNIIYEPNIPS